MNKNCKIFVALNWICAIFCEIYMVEFMPYKTRSVMLCNEFKCLKFYRPVVFVICMLHMYGHTHTLTWTLLMKNVWSVIYVC